MTAACTNLLAMTSGDPTTGATRETGVAASDQGQQWSTVSNPTRRPWLRTTITAGVTASLFLVCLLVLLGILPVYLLVRGTLAATASARSSIETGRLDGGGPLEPAGASLDGEPRRLALTAHP